jgi:queuine/archaeosine tRNA-ribosyltransferase
MTEEQKSQKAPIEFTEPKDGAPYIYANYVMVSPTQYDIRMTFGEVTDVNTSRVVIQKRVNVTVSWLEAKVLQKILTAQLQKYQETHGSLNFKEEMIGSGPDVDLIEAPGDPDKRSQHE